jgi:hypothetical protein
MWGGLWSSHTWLCRDERGGSLPDEVGSSSQHSRRKEAKGEYESKLIALLGTGREMSRNIHAISPSN